jgi:hypothetical protein
MNWGTKILIVYIAFVLGIVFMVFKSSMQNTDLVTTDYYAKELKYQEKIDEISRANALSSPVQYSIQGSQLSVNFPVEMKGKKTDATVQLYCVADKAKDIVKEIKGINQSFHFSIPGQNKGLHILKINWVTDQVNYYSEQKLMIP